MHKLLIATALLTAVSAHAAEYTVDPDHSSIGFKVRHLGISSVAGQFADVSGNFTFDPKNIKAASAQAKIAAKSVDTQQAKRDEHLRSPDFFAAEQFPEISFTSKEITAVDGNEFKVLGDLTIRGQTRPVTLDAEYQGSATDPWGNERIAIEAETTINRKDWGLTWNKLTEAGSIVVGEDVKITLEIQGIKKKSA